MPEKSTKASETLQAAYDGQYSDQATEWRELAGKYKAENILTVCGKHRFKKVLECGAGEGGILKFLDAAKAFEELYAIEISDSAIAQINKRALPRLKEVKKFNGYDVPYPDERFDMAYCSHVLEHVEHPRTLLRELKRVSRFQVFEIPLDYSVDADRKVKHYLSYGHINIFTPALFKFLLKSEGFEILEERFTQTADEVLRFMWYNNKKLKKNLQNELKLKLRPMLRLLSRIRKGRKRYQEFGFSAYTCLAQGTGELKIF